MRKLVLIFVFLLLFVGVTNAQHGDWDRSHDHPYTVQPGDTITGIANAFGVDANDLMVRNNIIDPNRIKVGQVLFIPGRHEDVQNPRVHVVGYGERLTDISIRYGVSLQDLIETNHIANPDRILPGQVIVLPPKDGYADYARTYRVDRGDTLSSIGRKFGVSWQQLAAYNHIWNPNYIQAGMLIKIPPSDYSNYDHSYDNYTYNDYASNYNDHNYQWNTYDNNSGSYDANGYHDPNGYDHHDDYGYHNGVKYHYDNNYYPTQPYPLTYIVKQGDVLEFISNWYGVSVEAIREFNDLKKWDPIFPGQVLLIPTANSPMMHHEHPSHSDYNGWYTVRRGDTLSGIAAYFNVSIYKLAEANDIRNWNSIYAGQTLRLPEWH